MDGGVSLPVASKENGLEVNAEISKYIFVPYKQNSEQNHNIKMGNKSFERFMKKLRADRTRGMSAAIRCRNFCRPVG